MASTALLDPETLQRITQYARQHIPAAKQASSATPNPAGPVFNSSSYLLPRPSPILADLIALGFGPDASIKLSQQYSRVATELKATYELGMHTTMQLFIQTNHGREVQDSLASVYQKYAWHYSATIRQRRDDTIATLKSLLHQRRKGQTSSLSEEPKRSTFDHGALSLLEAAFEEEAYPSREVKDQLADRTGMERRQIDVWFQNKRNRSKKQQKELRSARHFHKRDGSIIVFSPHCQIPDSPSSSASEDDEKVSPTLSSSRQEARDFVCQPPSHAFPTPYPPSEPLSTSALETPWPRRLATEARGGSVTSVEVDQLSEAFSRLTTIDTVETQTRHSVVPVRRSAGSCSTTCYGFTVIPPKAPLPALQLETATGTSSRAMASKHRVTRSSIGGDAASCPSSQTSSPSTPRRTRKRSPFARDGAHPYSPSSRHSSTSSRSSSGSSIYSLPTPSDSPLSSPTHKPINLPSEDV